MRGNVIDLAVAVVIGAAFSAVINSFVDDIINPIIGLVGGQAFSDLAITLKEAEGADPEVELPSGALITNVINFVMVAAPLFFVTVKPMPALTPRRASGPAPVHAPPAAHPRAPVPTQAHAPHRRPPWNNASSA